MNRRPNRRRPTQLAAAPAPAASPWGGVIALAKLVLGAGLVIEGTRRLFGSGDVPRTSALLGDYSGPMSPMQRDLQRTKLGDAARSGVIENAPVYKVHSIEQRVAYIRNLIRKGSRDPRILEVKAKILSAKCGSDWCVKPKDSVAEIKALFDAIHDPRSPYAMRYAKDHVWIDQFTNPAKLLKLHSGDCDDGTCLLGALFVASGYPVKMRVVQTQGKDSWSHIYLMVNTADANNAWLPIDWSVTNAYVGWEVPGASEVARTGRPSGMVVALRDFNV